MSHRGSLACHNLDNQRRKPCPDKKRHYTDRQAHPPTHTFMCLPHVALPVLLFGALDDALIHLLLFQFAGLFHCVFSFSSKPPSAYRAKLRPGLGNA